MAVLECLPSSNQSELTAPGPLLGAGVARRNTSGTQGEVREGAGQPDRLEGWNQPRDRLFQSDMGQDPYGETQE
jgi:hypothetical protein